MAESIGVIASGSASASVARGWAEKKLHIEEERNFAGTYIDERGDGRNRGRNRGRGRG